MRIPIAHQLGREEARRRLHDRSGEMAGLFPGGMAQVAIDWPGIDRMAITVTAMGKTVNGHVEVEDAAIVFEIALPAGLAFIEPMVRGTIEEKAQKLLA
ncbi:MAG: polyhydroxyalkanoic acid system family protein [Novosphingobium sp.]|uniref:polyhydroxyalkanoic acid system family protein n=1 Tax=Novosphingobium sp. TaxID=1874826 RepID=UPI0032B887BE